MDSEQFTRREYPIPIAYSDILQCFAAWDIIINGDNYTLGVNPEPKMESSEEHAILKEKIEGLIQKYLGGTVRPNIDGYLQMCGFYSCHL